MRHSTRFHIYAPWSITYDIHTEFKRRDDSRFLMKRETFYNAAVWIHALALGDQFNFGLSLNIRFRDSSKTLTIQ